MAHPTTVTKVWSFLGFTRYYCQFIPKFMQIAKPLHKLTSGENAGKKGAATTWNDRCQWSFNELKHLCTTLPILAYVNFNKPFKLHTDARTIGLGTILYQEQGDKDQVIGYAS